MRLPDKTRLVFFMSGALYVGGAIGFELIEGCFVEQQRIDNLIYSLTYSMLITVEESLEMGGVILFIWALLVYLCDNHKE